ncbi:MAG TPA: tetratricopeptide repeat protein, partial [Chthonomonadaceae bacterium]|nr:tetratricopeptide repeat protein [Chthonomonadaceae bacterium]
RSAVLTPAQMLSQLERRLDFLKSRRRDIAERHRTLRAVIDGSYRQLPGSLQSFFARLSVFRGGWTLEAAEEVCQEPEALDYLEALRETSLVIADVEMESSQIRFRMLETIREFAEEKLKPEDGQRLEDRHADYFLALAEAAEEAFFSLKQKGWLDRLQQEHDNLRAALQRCLVEDGRDAAKGLRLVAGLFRFWHHRGYWSEGRAFCERALAQSGAQERTRWRARALYAAAYLDADQGDDASAQARYEEGLAICREIGDRQGIAGALGTLGRLAQNRGELEQALALHTQSLRLRRELGDKSGVAASLLCLGEIRAAQADPQQAQSHFEEALTLLREAGNRAWEAIGLNTLGNLVLNQGRFEEARSLYEQALALHRDLEDKRGIAASLVNLGNVAANLQDAAAARAYYEESLFLNRELGARSGVVITLVNLGDLGCDQKDYAAARDHLLESLKLCQQLNAKFFAVAALDSMAALCKAQSQTQQAVRFFAAAQALSEAISYSRPPLDQEKLDRALETLRSLLGEEAFASAWEQGRAMTLDQALTAALEDEIAVTSASVQEMEAPLRQP